jgi:serine/threonine protein kinase
MAGAHLTKTGSVLGTPAFMAPEQARGLVVEIDEQTDVWAVGATMFKLLSGAFVHEGKSPHETLLRAATKPARSLGAVAPDVPRPIVELVDRALLTDKAQRWPSASAMREGLGVVNVALYGKADEPTVQAITLQIATLRWDKAVGAAGVRIEVTSSDVESLAETERQPEPKAETERLPRVVKESNVEPPAAQTSERTKPMAEEGPAPSEGMKAPRLGRRVARTFLIVALAMATVSGTAVLWKIGRGHGRQTGPGSASSAAHRAR